MSQVVTEFGDLNKLWLEYIHNWSFIWGNKNVLDESTGVNIL